MNEGVAAVRQQKPDLEGLRASVLGDLDELIDIFSASVSNRSALRTSAILRRLLIDNTLATYRGQSGLREPPQISCLDLDKWIPDRSGVRLAAAGDVALGSVIFGPSVQALPGCEVSTLDYWPSWSGRIFEYLRSTSVIAMGRQISRRDLIKYVANKLGGVHYDQRRRADDDHFNALDAATDRESSILSIDPADIDTIMAEMVGIAQHLVRAPQVLAMLPTAAQQRVPPARLPLDSRRGYPNRLVESVEFDVNSQTGEWSNPRRTFG